MKYLTMALALTVGVFGPTTEARASGGATSQLIAECRSVARKLRPRARYYVERDLMMYELRRAYAITPSEWREAAASRARLQESCDHGRVLLAGYDAASTN